MSEPITIELTTLLSAEMLAQLQTEAEQRHIPLPDMVREAIQTYLQSDPEEASDAEIESGFLQGWHEIMTGQTRPAEAVFDELRHTHHDDHTS
jgi:predicted transcriptional regulator